MRFKSILAAICVVIFAAAVFAESSDEPIACPEYTAFLVVTPLRIKSFSLLRPAEFALQFAIIHLD